MTFLISCDSVQTKLVCAQIEKATIENIPMCDISFKFNRCKCRCFNINKWKTVPDEACVNFASGEYPLQHCDGVAGFLLSDISTEVRPKIKLLSNTKADYCK